MPSLSNITWWTAEQPSTCSAGNLCWAAAMEFEVASRSVHCSVLDDTPDPQGDDKFRAKFMETAKRFMAEVCS